MLACPGDGEPLYLFIAAALLVFGSAFVCDAVGRGDLVRRR